MNYKDPNTIVKMFGPSISDPSQTVNRDVPERDVQAYKAAGYKIGSLPEKEWATVGATYSEEEALAHIGKKKKK